MENINAQDLQVIKIEYNGHEALFSNRPFDPAIQQAERFIERNKGKYVMRLYIRNRSPYGERWRWHKTVN